MKNFLCVLLILFSFSGVFAQGNGEKKFALKLDSVSLLRAFSQIEAISDLTFAYNKNNLPKDHRVSLSGHPLTINQIMDSLLRGTHLEYKISQKQVLVFQSNKMTISGTVEDKNTGERLINANIYNPATRQGVISNNYGFFSIPMPQGPVLLVCSYVGYKPEQIELTLLHDSLMHIKLDLLDGFEEVTIVGDRSGSTLLDSPIGMNELSSRVIDKIPALIGEVDVLKSLQLLPGVQSGTEGSSGIYVRGGGPDQNLILLDGVPIYNVNHLFGFFSIFNTDAIQNVKLIKGGFPARFGGRLSSIVDIRLKDGNNKKLNVSGSVGLISSKLFVEGPVANENTSFAVSARRTYADILAIPIISYVTWKDGQKGSTAGYYFYDLTAKINHRFSDRSRLFFSVYSGKDQASVHMKEEDGDYIDKQEFGLGWKNLTNALRWNYVITPKLFSNATITYSNYHFLTSMGADRLYLDTLQNRYAFSYNSGIQDVSGRVDFDWQPDTRHSIKFGYSQTWHQFSPGVTVYQYEEDDYSAKIDTSFGNDKIRAVEQDLYIEDEWRIGSWMKINYGLHGSAFKVQDSTYSSLQPRISSMFLLSENLSLKASYSQMTQNIHLLSNSTIGLPTDLWVPSTAFIKPQKSVQYAIGAVYKFKKGIEASCEIYYKSMENLIEYKEGSTYFSLDNSWQDKLEFGHGRAYGIELLIRKTTGKTTGWIGYTLSRSERKFENISFGEWFPYHYDRRHDVSLVLNHQFNDHFNVGFTWVYGSGYALTLPIMTYQRDVWPNTMTWPSEITAFEGRNSYRMPAYHRLDLGFNFDKEKKWGTRTWSFGAYNAYSRQNPFFITQNFYNPSNGERFVQLQQVSLFPIIPYVSYSFRFN